MFEMWLRAKGFDPAAITDEQRAMLRAQYQQELAAETAANGGGAAAVTGATAVGVETIDSIMAEHRTEQARVQKIVALTRKFIAAHPSQAEWANIFGRQATEQKMTAEQVELEHLRHARPEVPGMIVRGGQADGLTNGVLECAICTSLQLPNVEKEFKPETLEAAHERFRHGIGLKELLRLCASMNGHSHVSDGDVRGLLQAAFGPSRSPELRASDGFSTVEISGILSNVLNKFVMIAFNNVEQAWSRIAAVRPLRDFKTHFTYALTGNLKYEKVGNDGEIKHGALGETTYNVTADIYAKMITLTRKDIINDDLGALQEVPRKLGRGAALEINDVFWTAFLANTVQADGKTFYHAGHNNLQTGAGSALSSAALTSASVAFNKQTDPNGFPLAVDPRILIVPPELEYTALTLIHSALVVASQSSSGAVPATVPDKNIWQNKYEPVMSRYLSNATFAGSSATAWYLFASPEDLPAIQIGFLNGRQTPIIESAEADFDVLGIRVRGYHDFGVSLMEYRAANKSAGA